MPVIREQKSYINQPVGVVRAGADTFGVTTGIGELADTLITDSYNQLIEKAKKRGEDVAKTISSTRFQTLNPKTGQVEVLQPPSTFGRAAADAYQTLIERRYVSSLEQDITNKAALYATQFENSVDGFSKFKDALDRDVQTIVEKTDVRFQDLTSAMGSSLVASYEANFLQKEIARNIANTANATLVDLDNQASNTSSIITNQDFSIVSDPDGINEILETGENIQAFLDASSKIAHDVYQITQENEVLTKSITNTVSKVGTAYGELIVTEIARLSDDSDLDPKYLLALTSTSLRSGGKFKENLPQELQAIIDQVLSLKVNQRDINKDGEYEENLSRQELYPLISSSIQATLNQATPELGSLYAIHQEAINNIQRQNEIVQEISINKEHEALITKTIQEINDFAKSGDWQGIMSVIDSASNDSEKLLITENSEGNIIKTPDQIRSDTATIKRALLTEALRTVPFVGEPLKLPNGDMVQTDSFSLAESHSILLFAQRNDPSLLSDNIRQPILDLLDFAGPDRSYALETLATNADSVIKGFAVSVEQENKNQIVNDINQSVARPDLTDNRILFDKEVLFKMLSESGMENVETGGNIFLRPDYPEFQQPIVTEMMNKNIVSESLIKAYSGVVSGSINNPQDIFNIMSTMLSLDRAVDANGNPRNILLKALPDNEYAKFNAIKDVVTLEGTRNLPDIIGKLRNMDVNSVEHNRSKIAIYESFVKKHLKDEKFNFKTISDQNRNELILRAAFRDAKIDDPLVQADLSNRLDGFIDYHVAVNGNADAFSEMVTVMYDIYYQPNDSMIVDPANPTMERSVYSLRNKSIGQSADLRIKTATVINNLLAEEGATNAMMIAEDQLVPSGLRDVPLVSGMFAGGKPQEDIEELAFGDSAPLKRIFLMPLPEDPYGGSTFINRDSDGPVFTENTVYTAVIKKSDGSFEPFIFENKDGENVIFSISYEELHNEVFKDADAKRKAELQANYELKRLIQESNVLSYLPGPLEDIGEEQLFNMLSIQTGN